MDFSFTEEQEAVRELAGQVFAGYATTERVRQIEASETRVDRDLWRALADAGLLALAVPEEHEGSGLGLVELALLLEEQGRRVAPVPVWPTLVLGALPLAEFGTPEQRQRWLPGVANGEVILTAALAEQGVNDPLRPHATATRDGDTWRLDGVKPSVPAAHVADRVLVPATTGDDELGVFVVDPAGPGVDRTVAATTDRAKVAHLAFAGAPAEHLGENRVGEEEIDGRNATAWMLDRALVGLCALQVGVAEGALRMAAEYTSERHQFGRPLSTFQGVALKAADAYIDTEAMRVTLWQAAWRLTAGRDATREVIVAKWWAAEGGQRVVHITQHLHGGMGADVDYPVHRYFLWGKQIEDTLGGASAQLARLGRALAEAPA
ncbi:MAG TPA: acyl-CoA dehydrogenase family protein [Acidimicrobiia bacterium]|nr:acyl-CoA dehydrogenase family protein [Acidimicrobiia bacterium]